MTTTQTTTCARCPEPATEHIRVAIRPSLRVEPGRVVLDEDVCGAHTAGAAREAAAAPGQPEGALSADTVRSLVVAVAGSVHIGDVDPKDGHLYPGDRERIADAILAALGMGEADA